jgi:hypothetical protein
MLTTLALDWFMEKLIGSEECHSRGIPT